MLAGLRDPVLDGQRIFRTLLEATAHPGRILAVDGPLPDEELPPRWPLHAATTAVCLTLLDFETPLWLDPAARTPEVTAYLRFHCSCPIVDDQTAARFAVVAHAPGVPGLGTFDPGTEEYPDRSATVIVQARTLSAAGRRLTGPGIESVAYLEAEGLPARFWEDLQINHARFPRGVDVLLTAGRAVAALPRTTRVEG
ncbi:MAG TPA: phosphonate C-P lyase system protein PhnH [Methylomirabilota bacterium]|nr:phosphonate C-P lyase system protein PhnH [Methylomirabilota bacterium]